MILRYLLEDIDNVEINGNSDVEVNKIEYDSKKITQNDVFVAIKGYKEDGHLYIKEAIEKGAIRNCYS